ncbi:hypothetical protein [Aureispira anguillae]|uniref:Uncharacterized protein n=1 Tax=Aureispira anguillae TaxID=2864201 RepID=A0A915YB06_9BACT|nr:hypothetical protein [Aureispira anguillae]BDS09767.1 hypothetical protein AsAng_0004720 [Aureispira anguillae]
MNLSKFIVVINIIFMIVLFSASTISATNSNNDPIAKETLSVGEEKVTGGPRDVVQTMTDVTVSQQQTDNLYITIIKVGGGIQCKVTTDRLHTIISTEEWDAGDYRIETIDDFNVYQEFYITVN